MNSLKDWLRTQPSSKNGRQPLETLEKHSESIALLYSQIAINSRLYPEIDLDSLTNYFTTGQE